MYPSDANFDWDMRRKAARDQKRQASLAALNGSLGDIAEAERKLPSIPERHRETIGAALLSARQKITLAISEHD